MTMRSLLARLIFSWITFASCSSALGEDKWSASELEAMQSLWLNNLEALPPDRSNRVADDSRAADFGQSLFFDTRLSSNGSVACASCHLPEKGFQDGITLGKGVGTTNRRTMPIAGTAYSRFLFWDGRKDSQWAQALGPLESPVEHGGSRAQYAHVIADHYREAYEDIFGPLPDLTAIPHNAGPVADPVAAANWSAMDLDSQNEVTEIFVNIGKALAAYERRIQFTPSRFDDYVASLVANSNNDSGILTKDEKAGLRLFVGKANCMQCHNEPLFTNQEFHNTGVPRRVRMPHDRGRFSGAAGVLADEFNCRSRWSDIAAAECLELEYMVADAPELERSYKVPTLRNVAGRAPYMHAGQFATMKDVLSHYNKAPSAPAGHTEVRSLNLDANEITQLEAFLQTLDSPVSAPGITDAKYLSEFTTR